MLYCLLQKPILTQNSGKRSFNQTNDDSIDEIQPITFKKNHSIQNVLIESNVEEVVYNPKNYSQIKECPSIQLTNKQMQSDPIELFMELQKKYEKYGAVKLIASQGWNPPFMFRYVDKGITTRIQILQQLSQGKFKEIHYLNILKKLLKIFNQLRLIQSFEQKIEAYSIKAYESFAKNFQIKYKHKTLNQGLHPLLANQIQFWALQNDPKLKDHKVKVQYAADLPASKYGSGFPVVKMPNWLDADFQYQKSLFNLNNTYKSDFSLLKFVEQKGLRISGVTSPWVYMGMKFASFCWHVQDLYINSINYNHKGSTKTWYIIPKQYKQKVDQYVKEKYSKLIGSKPDILHRITLMFDPLDLIKNGIKVYKINQEQRCYVVTFSKVYHSGFSHGFNVGEAVNFISPLSYPYTKQAIQQYEQYIGKKMAIIPMQWPILQNYQNIDKLSSNEQFKKFIIKEYQQMLNKESQQIAQLTKKFSISQYSFIAKKNLKYDKNSCHLCKNYCYLSFLKCLGCNKNYCISHMNNCCINQFRLILRQSVQNRHSVLALLKNNIKFVEE